MFTSQQQQQIYFLGRAKRSAIQACIVGAAAAVGAPLLVRWLIKMSNGPWRSPILTAARKMNAQRAQQQPATLFMVDIILTAESKSLSSDETTFGDCLIWGWLDALGIHDGHLGRDAVLHVALKPFLADLLTYAIFAALDVSTESFFANVLSPSMARTISRISAAPTANGTARFNQVVEFELHTTYWWFPRIGRAWSLLNQNQQPGRPSAASAPFLAEALHYSPSSYGALVKDKALQRQGVVDQLVVVLTSQLALWTSYATHRVVCGSKVDMKMWTTEFRNSVVRYVTRCAIVVGSTVLLSKLSSWTPYSCATIANVFSYVVTGGNTI